MLLNTIGRVNTLAKRNISILRSTTRQKAAYEGEGKTSVRIINMDQDLGLMIDAYATYGFRLNNGLTVLGPMAIFPRMVLSWQVTEAQAITEQSLRLFKLLEPKIDLLILGMETSDRSSSSLALRAARAAGLSVEVLPTEHACATFNFLNAESRSVAAALIPPRHVHMTDNDMLHNKLHYDNMSNF